MFFGNNIKHLRVRRGLTQGDLAKQMEVAPQTVTGWESGKSYPHFQVLLQLRDFFEVDLESLVYRDLQQREVSGVGNEMVSNSKLLELYEELKGRVTLLEERIDK